MHLEALAGFVLLIGLPALTAAIGAEAMKGYSNEPHPILTGLVVTAGLALTLRLFTLALTARPPLGPAARLYWASLPVAFLAGVALGWWRDRRHARRRDLSLWPGPPVDGGI